MTEAYQGMSLNANRPYVIVETFGLYLITYDVRVIVGTPELCTTPLGIDNAAKIFLEADTMAFDRVGRGVGAQTHASLWIDSSDKIISRCRPSRPMRTPILQCPILAPVPRIYLSKQ